MVRIHRDSVTLLVALDGVILDLTQENGAADTSRDDFIKAVMRKSGGNVSPYEVGMYFDTFLTMKGQSGG